MCSFLLKKSWLQLYLRQTYNIYYNYYKIKLFIAFKKNFMYSQTTPCMLHIGSLIVSAEKQDCWSELAAIPCNRGKLCLGTDLEMKQLKLLWVWRTGHLISVFITTINTALTFENQINKLVRL